MIGNCQIVEDTTGAELTEAVEPGKIGAHEVDESCGAVRNEQLRFPTDYIAVLVESGAQIQQGRRPLRIPTMLVGALSVSIAVNLIFDMDQPFAGFIKISSAPMQQALEKMRP